MYMNTQELLSSVWLTNSVKGVRMKEIAQSPRSSPRLEPIQSLKFTLSTYWHKTLPTVTPIIQQLIEGWLTVLCGNETWSPEEKERHRWSVTCPGLSPEADRGLSASAVIQSAVQKQWLCPPEQQTANMRECPMSEVGISLVYNVHLPAVATDTVLMKFSQNVALWFPL